MNTRSNALLQITLLLGVNLLAAPSVTAQRVIHVPKSEKQFASRFGDVAKSTGNSARRWIGYTIPTDITRNDIAESFVLGNWNDGHSARLLVDDTSNRGPTILELLGNQPDAGSKSANQSSTLAILINVDPSSGVVTGIVTSGLSTHWSIPDGYVYWLGSATQQESYQLLRSIVDSSVEMRVLKSAIRCIGFHDFVAEASPWLKAQASGGSDLDVRKSAIYALGYQPGDSNDSFLDSMVRAEGAIDLRKAAAFSLGNREPQQAFKLLSAIASTTSIPSDVRKASVFAVADIHVSEVVEYLQSLAIRSGDEDVSKAAVYALVDAIGPDIAPLLAVFDQAQNTSVKKATIYSIADVESSEAVAALRDIAGGSHDRNLRKAAVYALGNVGTAEARDILRSMVAN